MPELPYTDTKPRGAADFYYAINATFRFIQERFGMEGWRHYLRDLGHDYFAPVNEQWRREGPEGVTRYWKAFFAAEPGADVEVRQENDRVRIEVRTCPALKHLKEGGREIVPSYCQHCHILGEARASAAGLTMRLRGGNGSCVHTYAPASAALPPQDPGEIEEVRP